MPLRRLSCPARASLRRRAPRPVPRCCASATPADAGSAGGVLLDKAAATKDELLSCLPYGPMPPALVADGVRFTFVEPALLSVRGRDEYTRLLSHWRTMMPERLLSSKYSVLRCFQPDARTLVVRWSVSWDSVPGCDWAALEADAAAAQSAEERLASLCTSLVAARDQLLLAQRQAPSQPLGAALASLEAGLAEAERLRAAAAAATRALPRQWGLSPPPTDDYGSGFAPAAAPPGSAASAALAALRASLTLCVRGSTTLQLDGDGRLEAHTESLDFTPVTESAVEAAAGPFDNVVPFLMAHRGLGPAARWPGWDFACLRTALWLTFRFGGMADEEARLQLEDRDEFDQAVTQALASFALVAFALAACAISWLVNDAPQLAAQLTAAVGAGEALADGGGGTQAAALALAPAATPPTGLDLFQMLRGPSLFRSNNF